MEDKNEKKVVKKEVDVTKLDFNQKLSHMIKEINETDQKVEIDGRRYTTVAKRNEIFRNTMGFDVQIITEHLHIDSDKVVFVCKISLLRDGQWQVISVGHAEESRSGNELNKLSAVEIAETSAIGRALANLGLNGGEFASLNEVASKSGLVAQASPELVEHVKSLVKLSGVSEKTLFAANNIKSYDLMKEGDALKLIKKCLMSIKQKKEATVKKNNDNPQKEDDIVL
jgi:hypothetical protein